MTPVTVLELADQPIPVYTNLSDALGPGYNNKDESELGIHALKEIERYASLADEFKRRFGRAPRWIVRAPGRVNLIGEHIDYSLFGVLPAAIEPDVLIACGSSTSTTSTPPGEDSQTTHPRGRVRVENLNDKYPRAEFLPTQRPPASRDDRRGRGAGGEGEADDMWDLRIEKKAELGWESYVKAGYHGILERFFSDGCGNATTTTTTIPAPADVDMLVSGSVPPGSGLSSSAALVVASTLAFLAVNDKMGEMTKGELVRMCVGSERRVGVNSGGMDQSSSILSNSSALYITFFGGRANDSRTASRDDTGGQRLQLRATPVPLPPRARFVVAHSLVVADKARSAKVGYNLRVLETRVGARVLGRRLGVRFARGGGSGGASGDKDGEKPLGADGEVLGERATLREVLDVYARRTYAVDGDSEDVREQEGGEEGRLERVLRDVLAGGVLECLKLPSSSSDTGVGGTGTGRTGVTLEEMVSMCGMEKEEFWRVYMGMGEVEATYFELYKRVRHVLEEALRVLEFRAVCVSGEHPGSSLGSGDLEDLVLRKLGALMDASQESCRELFECSCAELDELVRVAKGAGAFGSRLTGAGWGGCTVSLVDEDRVEGFIEEVKKGYGPYRGLGDEELGRVIFATKPGRGAFGMLLT